MEFLISSKFGASILFESRHRLKLKHITLCCIIRPDKYNNSIKLARLDGNQNKKFQSEIAD